jgi:hypothetical protein
MASLDNLIETEPTPGTLTILFNGQPLAAGAVVALTGPGLGLGRAPNDPPKKIPWKKGQKLALIQGFTQKPGGRKTRF